VNGLTATSVRLFQPWSGARIADCDFALEPVPMVPVGPAIVKVGTVVLLGTVDPDASMKFRVKTRARIIGRGGGWHRAVSARDFHNDVGVFSAPVIAATAAEMGGRPSTACPRGSGAITCAPPGSKRHPDRLPTLEAHHLARRRLAPSRDMDDIADPHAGHRESNGNPRHAKHPPLGTQGRGRRELGSQRIERRCRPLSLPTLAPGQALVSWFASEPASLKTGPRRPGSSSAKYGRR
jgi:hypothetical protein